MRFIGNKENLVEKIHKVLKDEKINGSSFFDFFESVKYEGHPLLWYFLLWFLNKITANPIIMQIVHWLISVATISIFIIYSPFNTLQKIYVDFSICFGGAIFETM